VKKLGVIIAALVLLGAGVFTAASAVPAAASGDDCVPTEDTWQRYSWTGGPHASDDPPPFPSEDWQANVAGDPHGIGVEGPYFVSHGNSGNGDWFYLELVPGHECPPVDTTTGGTTTDEPPCEETLAGQMLGCGEPPVIQPEPDPKCPKGQSKWHGKCYPDDAQKQPDGSVIYGEQG